MATMDEVADEVADDVFRIVGAAHAGIHGDHVNARMISAAGGSGGPDGAATGLVTARCHAGGGTAHRARHGRHGA